MVNRFFGQHDKHEVGINDDLHALAACWLR